MSSQGKVQYTNGSGLRFALSSRKNATTSNTDLYLSLQIPEKYGWGAVGIGNHMIGATMFITYPSSNGTGTTLSVRTTPGHFEPQLLKGVDCNKEVMKSTGSEIESGFVCYGVGDMTEFTTNPESAGWVWAVGPFQSVHSDDVNYGLYKHSERGTFTLNMTEAKVLAPAAQPTVSGMVASATALLPSFNPQVGNSGSVSTGSGFPSLTLITVHSILLGISFIVIFPLGVILLRLGNARLHMACQLLGFAACVAGLAIGVNFSMNSVFSSFNLYHQIIGMTVVSLLLVQAVAGQWHHINYKKLQSRTWISYFHLILGKLLLPLGMINACLGYHVGGKDSSALAYGLVALVVIVALYCLNFYVYRRARRQAEEAAQPHSERGQTGEHKCKSSRFFG